MLWREEKREKIKTEVQGLLLHVVEEKRAVCVRKQVKVF